MREVIGAVALVVRLWTRAGRGGRRSWRARSRTSGFVAALGQDIRFGLRTLRRNRGYTLVTTGVLAVGIGANVAIFCAVNAFVFRPLPFADAERLVTLYETNPEFGWDLTTLTTAAPANVLDWRERVDGFADIAAYQESLTQLPYVPDATLWLLMGAVALVFLIACVNVASVLLPEGRRARRSWRSAWRLARAAVA